MTTTHAAEIQRAADTLSRRGTAAEVAAWLASWRGPAGRSVAVYRVEVGKWILVAMRRTLTEGTVPSAIRVSDPAWLDAVKTAPAEGGP